MLYLFIQTWGWILAAFILGLLVGWWLCCRCKCNRAATSSNSGASANAATSATAAAVTAAPASADVSNLEESSKPIGFTSAPAEMDELKRIRGIGPVIERTLNDLGIYQFKQIAELSRDNIEWVESYLSFPGRIDREEWVTQAKALSSGGETEFSKRVDKGELDY